MFKDKLTLIPHLPGSYQYRNKDGIIIYVGKAKDLNRRVNSYFNKEQFGKTKKLVSEIADIDYIVTNSELESFILELNLIKKFNPKYNILLKDDKSYPYIEFIKKPYPTLKIVRYLKIKKKKDSYLFGPYQNVYAARKIVNLLNRLYPLKKCSGKPKEVCLYYHINECLGYCVKELNQKVVDKMNEEIIEFLNGNDVIIRHKILEKIELHSSNLNYEVAKDLKNELDYMNVVLAKQRIELLNVKNADFINYYFDKGYISIVIFFIRNSKTIGTHHNLIPLVDEEIETVENYIGAFYNKHEIPPLIVVDKSLDEKLLSNLLNSKVSHALKGEKKKVLEIVLKNAKLNLENDFELVKKNEEKTFKANEELKNILHLDKLDRIDIFDNSNLFGSFSVSAMVVYKNGLPSKKDYRKYKISLEKNDDYNTMREVIYRRYYKALLEHSELPDLIIVDGGEKQITACKEIIDSLHIDIMICGLKKNDRHRTNELIDENLNAIRIDKESELFYYLTNMQDEVHRFTINYHKQIRSKGTIASVLDNVENIGVVRRKELIKKYGSINKIMNTSIEELNEILPLKTAENLINFLKNYKK